MSKWETGYHFLLSTLQNPTPFIDTAIAEELATTNYVSTHHLLDYSSVSPKSILVNKLFDTEGLKIMFEFLAMNTKKRLALLANEQTSDFLVHVFCPAPKSYLIEELKHDLCLPLKQPTSLVLPNIPDDPINYFPSTPLTKRGKGTKKNILKYKCFVLDFIKITKLDEESRSIDQYSIKRKNFRLYIMKSRKRLLANNTCKRLVFLQSRNKFSHFSFPLHAKRIF